MKVVCARPPRFEELDAVFHIAGKPIIFAFGDTIYNPCGVSITPELQAHEGVHGQRQLEIYGLDYWWDCYIANPQFRLAEEIPAHQAEYRTFCERNRLRNARRIYLRDLAQRLSSPLYGRLIKTEEARRVIKTASPHL